VNPGSAVSIQGLTLHAGTKCVLENADLRIEEGECVLLVGLSGAGKSLTMRLLLGLLHRRTPGFSVEGDVRIFGQPAEAPGRHEAGIVFQDFGLLDEWDVEENIRFGLDHRPEAPAKPGDLARSLMVEFDLPAGVRPAHLSGGMKQRCALARTLAYDPRLLLFDEPTSGLDPAMAAQVAGRIRATHDAHGKTTLVVTHDLTALRDIADRVILLDPRLKGFREVERDRVEAALETLRGPGGGVAAPQPRVVQSLAARGKRGALAFLDRTGRVVEGAALSAWALVPRWPRARWGWRYLLYDLRLTTLGSALLYVAVAGAILGLIVTWFTFSFLPFKPYTEPLLLDRVLGAIGFALFRIMAPGMTALLVAARNGAALSADLGHRAHSRQLEAMRSFGVAPERYLFTNALWAQLLGMPVLLAVNYLAARYASLAVFILVHPEQSTHFWAQEFDRFVLTGGALPEGMGWLVLKTELSALVIAAIAWFQGSSRKESGRDVASAVTRTIIWSTLAVLLVQLVIALAEFEPL